MNQNSINLPPEVSVQKERLSYGWAYVFRHSQLGQLGRVILQGRSDGRTHIICELAGEPDDPMTAQRAAIFEPLGKEISRQMDLATGGTGEEQWVEPPPRPAEPQERVATKLMQCERCDAGVALLIFAEQATDSSGLEDYARLMYPKVKEFNVPTWVIGPSLGQGPPEQRPADILKIWPQREPLCRLRPDEFNAMIDALAATHCEISPDIIQLVSRIDEYVQRVLANGGDDEELLLSMADHMGTFKQVMEATTKTQMDQLCQRFDGFYRFAKLLENLAQGIADGSVSVPKD